MSGLAAALLYVITAAFTPHPTPLVQQASTGVHRTHVAAESPSVEPANTGEPGGSVADLIAAEFGSEAARALRVARCESGLNPSARNGQFRGVFQVGEMHAESWLRVTGVSYWDSWMDASVNVRYAHWLWEQDGWSPWSCR